MAAGCSDLGIHGFDLAKPGICDAEVRKPREPAAKELFPGETAIATAATSKAVRVIFMAIVQAKMGSQVKPKVRSDNTVGLLASHTGPVPSYRVRIVRARSTDAAKLSAIARAAKAHWGYPAHWLERWCEQLTITAEFIA